MHEFTMGETEEASAYKRLCEVHPQGVNRISARLYEYFVVHYTQIRVCIHRNVNIGEEYEKEWKKRHKKNFTFFRRGTHQQIKIPGGPIIGVTEPTLRFLDWVAKNQIDVFILENMDDILKHKNPPVAPIAPFTINVERRVTKKSTETKSSETKETKKSKKTLVNRIEPNVLNEPNESNESNEPNQLIHLNISNETNVEVLCDLFQNNVVLSTPAQNTRSQSQRKGTKSESEKMEAKREKMLAEALKKEKRHLMREQKREQEALDSIVPCSWYRPPQGESSFQIIIR